MRAFIDKIQRMFLWGGAAAFFIFFICVALQVMTRYIPGITFLWSAEVATYAFIWMVLLGAAAMVRERQHFTVSILLEKLSGKYLLALQVVIHFFLILFGLAFVIHGIQITAQFSSWTLNYLPGVSQFFIWLPVPIAGAGIMLFAFQNAMDHWRHYQNIVEVNKQ